MCCPSSGAGGGVVQIWDRGRFDNVSVAPDGPIDAGAALERGHLSFVLHGEKLRGGFSLIRTGSPDDGPWLLIKKRDGDADARRVPTVSQPQSVVTGRTMAEIEADGA